jgi:methionine synthase II (cobalamin-independent)
MLQGFKDDNEDSDALFDAYVKLYNDCLSERPADLHVGVHLCRGNFVGGRHFSEGGYDAIATKLFRNLNVDTYYLEYDTARAGGFEPLKEVPPHKKVILGLVTTKFPELEDLEELKKKVYQAADLVAEGSGQTREQALNQLGVSPQCGFASHSDGNNVGKEDMVKKLQLVRKLADEIWPGEA